MHATIPLTGYKESICPRRPGAVILEAAIVLPVCLVSVIAVLDLCLAVARENSLAEAARRGARLACVRGQFHTPEASRLGPAEWTGTAAADHPLASGVRPILMCMDPARVNIHAQWPDGNFNKGDRVRINVTYRHRSVLGFWSSRGDWVLTATSVMKIVH